MGTALAVVNQFYEATNEKRDVKATAPLVADDMTFVGPVLRTAGAQEYLTLDPVQRTPTGGHITLLVADWIRVANGKVAEQKIYYDPRAFLRAYAAELGGPGGV